MIRQQFYLFLFPEVFYYLHVCSHFSARRCLLFVCRSTVTVLPSRMRSSPIWDQLFFLSEFLPHHHSETILCFRHFTFTVYFHLFLSPLSSVALMNHSCSPNVIVTYKGTVAEVRAVQEINPGEEVLF